MSTALGAEASVSRAMLRRVAVASCVGTTVEWYEFFILRDRLGAGFQQPVPSDLRSPDRVAGGSGASY
jgi:hypothetical protein